MAPSFKLYYTPTSCGAANFIVASLAGFTFDSEQVDIRTKKTSSGADYSAINPKGNVPCISFEDGRPILNENTATLTFLADQNLDAELSPAEGTPRRYDYINALGFVNSELHPRIGGLFAPCLDDKSRDALKANALRSAGRFADLILEGKDFCLKGDKLTTADVYAYIVFSWAPYLGLDLSSLPKVVAFQERVKNYPGVAEAHAKMDAATKAWFATVHFR